jgi:hypothetical protein
MVWISVATLPGDRREAFAAETPPQLTRLQRLCRPLARA